MATSSVFPALEAILFAAAKPLALKDLSAHLGISQENLEGQVQELFRIRNRKDSGIHVLVHEGKVQLVSNPLCGESVAAFLKKEASGPLTRPSLEALTIIAYRGPLTKSEVEIIRGVNCSLILRNLLIRGLIEETEDQTRLQPVYTVSAAFLRALGLTRVNALPDYESFAKNEKITELLNQPLPESV